jgi:hypothetical protein
MGCAHIPVGLASENAAHRIAVEWDSAEGLKEGVYVPRRDTNSKLNSLTGGRLFPGDYRQASFEVTDEEGHIVFHMRSDDGEAEVRVQATESAQLNKDSVFGTLGRASEFFRTGSLGYSRSCSGDCLEGMTLDTDFWSVAPLDVESVYSSYFYSAAFPQGSVEFDSALIMRDIPHTWRAAPDLKIIVDAA